MTQILLIPLVVCAAGLALALVVRRHRRSRPRTGATMPRPVPRKYGHLIYRSTALTVVGLVPLSGAFGPAAAVKAAGAALVALGIAGTVATAIAMTVAVRR